MTGRLTSEDWILFGLKELAKGGPTSLRADTLAKKMGVSRGSFYWHFQDIADFKAGVLAAWRQQTTESVIASLEHRVSASERLAELVSRAMAIDLDLERAIRSWSVSDQTVAQAVAEVDKRRITYVEKLLSEIGIAKPDVRVRARTVYWASLGRVMITDPKLRTLTRREVEQLVGLLVSQSK